MDKFLVMPCERPKLVLVLIAQFPIKARARYV